jgi:hypothetical protein
MTSQPLPATPDEWRNILDTALEHASHAWARTDRPEEEKDWWPPKTSAEVGTVEYHLAAMIGYVFEVYSGIAAIHPEVELRYVEG